MALHRDLSLPWQSRAMQDVLQSLFLAELVSPSSELWLLSAWVSDIEVIDNRARAFSGLRPDWPPARIRLSNVLETLVTLGAQVFVVMRYARHNKAFLRRLEEIQRSAPGRLGIAVGEAAHEKTIVGDDFVLSGSMNFTNLGLTSNDEYMLLRIDESVAASHRLDLKRHWEEVLKWQ